MKYHTKIVCENEVDAVPEVVKWNSWDAEHLKTIHKAYLDPVLLLNRQKDALFVDKFKIPLLGIRLNAMVFTTQWDESNQVSYVLTPFFLAKNNIKVIAVGEKRTRVQVTYEFSGTFWQSLLFPIFRHLIKRWNKVVWEEDLPLKLRRQKALEYGFIDYVGLPERLEDRKDLSLIYKSDIPVRRTEGISETRHPFYIKDDL